MKTVGLSWQELRREFKGHGVLSSESNVIADAGYFRCHGCGSWAEVYNLHQPIGCVSNCKEKCYDKKREQSRGYQHNGLICYQCQPGLMLDRRCDCHTCQDAKAATELFIDEYYTIDNGDVFISIYDAMRAARAINQAHDRSNGYPQGFSKFPILHYKKGTCTALDYSWD